MVRNPIRTRRWATCLLVAVGCSGSPAELPRSGGLAEQGRFVAPSKATAGVPVALGVVFPEAQGLLFEPGEVCFRFGDASDGVCTKGTFVAHTFAGAGRYRLEATWPGCGGSCPAEQQIEVTPTEGGLFRFRLPSTESPVPFLDIPYPNDLYLDPTTGGIRIGNLRSVLPFNHGVLEAALPELKGFGTSTAVHFPVSGSPPHPELTAQASRSGTGLGSPVFLINVDPDSPEYGRRQRVDCSYDDRRSLLILRPKTGYSLLPETRYAAVVTTSLWNEQGAFCGNTAMRQVLDPPQDSVSSSVRPDHVYAPGSPDLRTRAVYEPALRRILEEPDIPDAGVLAAVAPFTTQPTVRHLQAIRRQLEARPVPQAQWTRIFDTPGQLDDLLGSPDEHTHIRALAHGRYRTEIYQTPDEGIFHPGDQSFRYDAQGKPVVQGTEELDFTLVLPKAGRPAGSGIPVVIFQHGIGGNRVSMLDVAGIFAEAGFATVGIDAAAHGSRSVWASADREHNRTGARGPDGFPDHTPFSQVSAAEFFAYLLNMSAMRDNLRQTAVDLMQLVRLLQNPDLDLSPFPGVLLCTESLYLLGDSLGGMFSVLLLAVEPSVRTAVLNVTGGGLLTEVVGRSPDTAQWVMPFLPLLYGVPAETILDPVDPVVTLFQTVIDPGDPVNLAPYVLRGQAGAEDPRRPPTSVLQIMVEGDETVSNASNEALARAFGIPLLDPFARPVPGLETVTSPLQGNVRLDGWRATAALVQCSPACHGTNLHSPVGELVFVPGFPYPPGYDEPFPRLPVPVQVPQPYREVQAQILHFFGSHRDTGTAEILAFWTPYLDRDLPDSPDDLE